MNGDGKADILSANRLSDRILTFGGVSILLNQLNILTAVRDVTPAELSIKATPNPFTSTITVSIGKTLNKLVVKLVDVNGKTLYTHQQAVAVAGSTIYLSKPGLTPGIYYLLLETNQGKTAVQLLKQ